MKSAITRMLRFGRKYSVALDCGHKLEISLEDAAREQLFIGKRVECAACAREQAQEAFFAQYSRRRARCN
jgi:hypothetical protein